MVKMQKKRIITIAGRPGSGKSTTSKAIAAQLGYQHFSSGDLFRSIGKERGVDVNQINLLAEQEKEIDHLVDQRLRDIGENEDKRVIDSRMAWHWMPQSFKVYLDLGIEIAAQRILKNMDPERIENEHIPDDPAEYGALLQERLDSEARRYRTLYDVDPYDHANYDLVVDTASNGPEAVVDTILKEYSLWLDK